MGYGLLLRTLAFMLVLAVRARRIQEPLVTLPVQGLRL